MTNPGEQFATVEALVEKLGIDPTFAALLCRGALLDHIARRLLGREEVLSSHQHPKMYERLGITISELGCVMALVDPLDIVSHVPDGKQDLYVATSEELSYAQGAVGEVSPHVTILYGLLESAEDSRAEVDEVLAGWTPSDIAVVGVSYFESQVEGEDFYCIVAEVAPTENLLEGHARLSLLPHINTFRYKPHVTLACVKKDEAILNKWLTSLSRQFTGRRLSVKPELKYS